MEYRIAWRTGRLRDLTLSWASRFCQDGELTRVMRESPLNDDQSAGLICSMKVTWPERSSWAAVESCGTPRNTTLVKCEPDQPPQYFPYCLRMTSISWPLSQVSAVYGPVPVSCPAFSQSASFWPAWLPEPGC